MVDAGRRGPLAGYAAPPNTDVVLTELPPAARFVFRARAAAQAAATAPLGIALPTTACRAAVTENRAALWLGPDEWLLVAPEADGPTLAAALESALAGLPHSLVDVSHRQSGLTVSGPRADDALNTGCPLDLDLSAFPIGMCTRTVFGKSQVTLWRTGAENFRLEAARSYLPYVWDFLTEASREFSG